MSKNKSIKTLKEERKEVKRLTKDYEKLNKEIERFIKNMELAEGSPNENGGEVYDTDFIDSLAGFTNADPEDEEESSSVKKKKKKKLKNYNPISGKPIQINDNIQIRRGPIFFPWHVTSLNQLTQEISEGVYNG